MQNAAHTPKTDGELQRSNMTRLYPRARAFSNPARSWPRPFRDIRLASHRHTTVFSRRTEALSHSRHVLTLMQTSSVSALAQHQHQRRIAERDLFVMFAAHDCVRVNHPLAQMDDFGFAQQPASADWP
jgi:hypothetical protein